MRRILVENARRKSSLKRGGRHYRVDLAAAEPATEGTPEDLLALDEALRTLAQRDPLKAEIVKLRYFAGLTLEETAQALGVARSTAAEHWAYARAWLRVEIAKGDSAAAP
jgi:RNA polymerase sigma factor (TIGR02999 family)